MKKNQYMLLERKKNKRQETRSSNKATVENSFQAIKLFASRILGI